MSLNPENDTEGESGVDISQLEKKQKTLLVNKLRVVGGVLFGLVVVSAVVVLTNLQNVIGNLLFVIQFIDIFNGTNLFLLANKDDLISRQNHSETAQMSCIAAIATDVVVLSVRIYRLIRSFSALPGTDLRALLPWEFLGSVILLLMTITNITALVFVTETKHFIQRIIIENKNK